MGGTRFLAPAGHEGILVVTPSVESISEHRVSAFPATPVNFYQLCGLPPSNGKMFCVAACRSHGVGLIDLSVTSPETGLRLGAFDADVVDVTYAGNETYPYAIAAVGIRGELLLCRDIVHQEAPITLHYQNLAGRVYRVLAGHGHLFILTSKALYVLGDLARRLVQPTFDESKTPVMTVPMEAIDAAVVDDKWLLAVMPDSVRKYHMGQLHQRIVEFARNDVHEKAVEPTRQAWSPRELSPV